MISESEPHFSEESEHTIFCAGVFPVLTSIDSGLVGDDCFSSEGRLAGADWSG